MRLAEKINPPENCRPDVISISQSDVPDVLADIYQPGYNIAVWKRNVPADVQTLLASFIKDNPALSITATIDAKTITPDIRNVLPAPAAASLIADIAELTEMFCCLFDLTRAGMRLKVLNKAMCPRFHTDRVPCRLITTYCGEGTQWLPHNVVNRAKLGPGSNGQPDHLTGLYAGEDDIQSLKAGDVGLLKGEMWEGNENAGIVHRSPPVATGEQRLLLTLDAVY